MLSDFFFLNPIDSKVSANYDASLGTDRFVSISDVYGLDIM